MIVDTETWVDNRPFPHQEQPNHGQEESPKVLLRLVVEGKPIPQPRFRVNWVTRALYNPEKKRQQDLRKCLKGMVGARPMPLFGRHNFLRVSFDFYFQRPRSHFAKKGQELVKKAPKYPVRGDADNFLKFVQDAGNHILYHDDSQIVSVHANLYYCIDDKTPPSFALHISNI